MTAASQFEQNKLKKDNLEKNNPGKNLQVTQIR